MKRMTSLNLKKAVESVESVETSDLISFSIDHREQPHLPNRSTTQQFDCVESVSENDLSSYFSTLSTKMKRAVVENKRPLNILIFSGLQNIPRIPQLPREKSKTMNVGEKV